MKTTIGAIEVILQHINASNAKAHLKLRRHELSPFEQMDHYELSGNLPRTAHRYVNIHFLLVVLSESIGRSGYST